MLILRKAVYISVIEAMPQVLFTSYTFLSNVIWNISTDLITSKLPMMKDSDTQVSMFHYQEQNGNVRLIRYSISWFNIQ